MDFDECAAEYAQGVATVWKCLCLLPRVSSAARWDLTDQSPLVPPGLAVRLDRSDEGSAAGSDGPPAAHPGADRFRVVATADAAIGSLVSFKQAFLVQPPPGAAGLGPPLRPHHAARTPPPWTIPVRVSDGGVGGGEGEEVDASVDPRRHGHAVTCGTMGYGSGAGETLHLFAGLTDLVADSPGGAEAGEVEECGHAVFEVDHVARRVLKFAKPFCAGSAGLSAGAEVRAKGHDGWQLGSGGGGGGGRSRGGYGEF